MLNHLRINFTERGKGRGEFKQSMGGRRQEVGGLGVQKHPSSGCGQFAQRMSVLAGLSGCGECSLHSGKGKHPGEAAISRITEGTGL